SSPRRSAPLPTRHAPGSAARRRHSCLAHLPCPTRLFLSCLWEERALLGPSVTCLLQSRATMDDRRVIDVSLRTRLEAFMRDGERVYEGDVEALHRTRVASRRLRELVPVLGLSGDTARKVGQRLKKVTKRLGVVRELDVLMLMIDELGRDSRYSS